MSNTAPVKLTAEQCARLYGMGLTTFCTLRRIHKNFPQATSLIGRRHAWNAAEVIAWFNANPTRYSQQFDPFDAAQLAQHTDATPAKGTEHA